MVYVVGVGQTKFGELWEKSLEDLIVEASLNAMQDAGIEKNDINSIYIGNMSAGRFIGQEHVGALAASALGLNVPATRCEAACASGSVAFRSAYNEIKSGKCDAVLVIGAEKMTDLKTEDVVTTLASAGNQEWEGSIGLTFAGLYALMARAHMKHYGTTREQLAMVSVNNHKNAVNNKYAQYGFEIDLKTVINSPMIADPLRLFDCSPITDGAAAVILVSDKLAKKFEKPVKVLGTGQASDTLSLYERQCITEMLSTKLAAKRAFKEAEIGKEKIDVIEVHDCFTINEILCIEDLGFCKKGNGGKFVENGEISLNGSLPTNTTGGLKACGHPVGATGVRQICDVVKQIRGDSINQINGVKYGLNLNIGGSGATAVVNIFGGE